MPLEVQPVTADHICQFVAWRYDPPYHVYDITDDVDKAVDYFLSPEVNCRVIVEDERLVGFCTFGHDAQVPGGDYSKEPLDIGMGIDPELTGRGRGREFVEAAIDHAARVLSADHLRVTIATPNQRAIRAWTANGFTETARFVSSREVLGTDRFVILERQL